ncbi:uncharacterized protein LOC129283060 [Lytechinus pictus]|uniref:uncharacterized protein LOC129283060 n=1 Tax=Lytechinus pictus TaxID=7653 RepID=UPI0030B9C039
MEVWFEAFSYCGMTRKQYQDAYRCDIPMEYEGNEEEAEKGAKLFERIVRSKIEPDRIMYGKVKERIEASTSKYLVTKEMFIAFPDEKTRRYLPTGFLHVFLIRDPYRVFSSYRRAIYKQLQDVGLRTGDPEDMESFDLRTDDPSIDPSTMFTGMHDLWTYIRDKIDPEAVIMNTDELLASPGDGLSKLCHAVGLPFSPSLLQWDPSPDVVKRWNAAGDDVVMATKAFYQRAINSSRFLPPSPDIAPEQHGRDVRTLAEAAMPYFKEMDRFKI